GSVSVLTLFLFVSAPGCGSRHDESKPSTQEQAVDKAPATTATHESHPAASAAPRTKAKEGGPTTRVLLTAKGCVEFEPHWTSIQPGQSLTWRSQLKSLVTIHVSPGAFDKTEYVVRPGATVSTGAARGAGSYSIWTEPAACQTAPEGVHGSGPGLTVAATAAR